MLLEISLGLGLIADCAEEFKNLGGSEPTKAIVRAKNIHPDRLGVPSSQLAAALGLPSEFNGEVAILSKKKNLRIFGITNFDENGFEFISIWGFDQFPLPLATIYIDEKPGSTTPAIKLYFGPEPLYTALQAEPKLLELIQKMGYLNVKPEDHAKTIEMGMQVLDDTMKEASEHEVEAPQWSRVLKEIYQKEIERKSHLKALQHLPQRNLPQRFTKEQAEAATPYPPNRESQVAVFGGWLPGDHSAEAIIEDIHLGKFQGRKIYLHPKFRKLNHSVWLGLDERIALEGRFEMSWLKLKEFQMVEFDPAPGKSSSLYMIVKNISDLPSGFNFYRIDPMTGASLSPKPEMLATPALPD